MTVTDADAPFFLAPVDPALRAAFAPTGVLRAAINLGNPILAHAGQGGAPGGVSVDLARAFAAWLGVPLQPVVVDAAGRSVEAVNTGAADLGFFAIDPLRGQGIAFTDAYVLIEGCYLVKADSPLWANEAVDQAGRRVVVGQGSAYDLHLTRALTQATIERAPTSPAVVRHFLDSGADVAAGVRQQLEADARALAAAGGPALRLLPGRFMVIRQAMGVPKARGEAAAATLHGFVEAAKASGFLAAALARHRIEGAGVAPPATDPRGGARPALTRPRSRPPAPRPSTPPHPVPRLNRARRGPGRAEPCPPPVAAGSPRPGPSPAPHGDSA